MALDDPDLPEALGYLRSTALGLSPRGLATKLIIPNDQILYTAVTAPGPDETSRLAQIRAGLVGLTPYEVDDLAFDWSAQGDLVQVAVIARETLAEAEAFAAEHRFNPVAFVALPQDGAFQGEPWFGPTALAATLLAAGESVERDAAPVNVVARSFAAEPMQDPQPEFVPEPEFVPVPEFVPEPKFEPEFEPAPQPEADPEIVPEEIPAPHPEYAPEPDDQPEPEFTPEPEYLPAEIAQAYQPPPYQTPRSEPVTPDLLPADLGRRTFGFDKQTLAQALADPLPEPEPTPAPQPLAEAEEAPMALDVADEEPEALPDPVTPTTARVVDPGIDDDLPPLPSAAVMVAFSSRRSPDDMAPGKGSKPPALGAAIPAKGPVPRPSIAKPLPSVGSAPERAQPARPTASAVPPRPVIGAKANAADKALRGFGALVSPATSLGGKKTKVTPAAAAQVQAAPIPTAPVQIVPKTAPAQPNPMRSGIGLGGKPAPVRGKPRYLGLMLTLILLVFLALIAAWSSYSLAFWQSSDPPVDAAVMQAETPAPDDEMLADMQDPAELAMANTAEQMGAPVADLTTDVATSPPTEAPTDQTAELPPQAQADLALTPETTQPGAPQDEILLATMDAPPNAPDPLSLPPPDARGDPLPSAQPAPPPFGTVYQFDADGLIRATPEGIITPEGVLLIAGKPKRVPEPRPAEVIAAATQASVIPGTEAAALAGTASLPGPATLPESSAFLPVDPALAGKRPQARPAALVKPDDGAALAPAAPVDTRLAGLRPQARPKTILAAGEEARLASASASLAAQAEAIAVSVAAADASAARSTMAVAISRKPEARPRDLSKSVEAAVAAAIRTPEPEPEITKAAAKSTGKDPAPEADNEPEIASAMPAIPTRASVAKQATFKNAINLSKVNLIGVYGSNSNRHALIRQANGRFKKVQVGDKIDGGQIAAITATEVRYKKGGKMITLAMPKG